MNAFLNRFAAIFRALAQRSAIADHAGYFGTLRRSVFGIIGFLPLMLLATPLSAAYLDVNVDLEGPGQTTYSGTAVSPDPGTFWNGNANSRGTGSGPTVTSGFLTASDGSTATGEQFTLGNFSQTAVPGDAVVPALFADFVYDTTNSNAAPGTFAITGLTSGATYSLYMYSMTHYDAVSNNTVFAINGLAGSTTTVTGRPVTDGIDSSFVQVPVGNPGGQTLGNYVFYPGIVASGGQISGTFEGTNERFNGFQIQQFVPEPSSVVLIGMSAAAALAMFSRRRRVRCARRATILALLAVAGLSLLAGAPLSAALIDVNVNFKQVGGGSGPYSGTGAAPDGGTYWNNVYVGNTPPTYPVGSLLQSDGVTPAPGVAFTLTTYGTIDVPSQLGPSSNTSLDPTLFGDYVYANPTGTFSITGLASGGHYDLYLNSMIGYPNDNNTVFTINGQPNLTTLVTGDQNNLTQKTTLNAGFVAATTGNDPTGNDLMADSALTLGNYVEFANLTATGGTISGTFYGTNVRFNGFQIDSTVPEPSSVVLLGLSAAGLAVAAWRRRRS